MTLAAGTPVRLFDPSPSPSAPWHVNDHCFVQGPDGRWHVFGIVWPDVGVAEPDEIGLGHASAPALAGPWEFEPYALHLDRERGETVLWAPHVVRADDGLYHLFYCSGGDDWTDWAISLATSEDLATWDRQGPVVRDGFQARDPMVLWIPEERRWAMYYCATDDPSGGAHVVACRTSSDLRNWSEREIVYTDEHRGTEYGPTESPFVVRHGATYYLFVGPRPYDPPTEELPNWRHDGYDGTDVFRSASWRGWTNEDLVAHVPFHAPEVVNDEDGRWHISHCGIARGGLYLAPLEWGNSD